MIQLNVLQVVLLMLMLLLLLLVATAGIHSGAPLGGWDEVEHRPGMRSNSPDGRTPKNAVPWHGRTSIFGARTGHDWMMT